MILFSGLINRVFNSGLVKFDFYNIKTDLGQTTDLSEEKPEILSKIAPVPNKYWIEMRDEGRRND